MDRASCLGFRSPLSHIEVFETAAAVVVKLGIMPSARKSSPDPERSDGPPVAIAWASHGVEAEMWAALLEDHGIPSLVQRSPGADVPDFLASGRHTVRVRADHAERAREILGHVEDATSTATGDRSPVLVVGAVVLILLLLASALLSAVVALL